MKEIYENENKNNISKINKKKLFKLDSADDKSNLIHDIKKNPIVIYTAITNDYDDLKEVDYIDENCKYVCFTDNPNLKSDTWQIIQMENSTLDHVRKAKQYKIFPDIYFPEFKYSFWIDGSFKIIGSIREYIYDNINSLMLCINHSESDCLFDEANKIKKEKRYSKFTISKQISQYENEGMPKHFGFFSLGAIFRKHDNPIIIDLMRQWWEEIITFSNNDEISFPYVMWKNDFYPFVSNINILKNKYWRKDNSRLHNYKIKNSLVSDNIIDAYEGNVDNVNHLTKEEISLLISDIESLNEESKNVYKKFNNLNKEIDSIRNSNSLKLSKPFKKIYSPIKKEKNKLKRDFRFKKLYRKYFVSVIIPTCDDKEGISNSLESVLKQTYENFEIIIVDYGCDDTEKIIKDNYSDYDNIKYFKLKNHNIFSALNKGLNESNGNVIAYLNSNSTWIPSCINRSVNKIDRDHADSVYSNFRVINTCTDEIFRFKSKFNRKKLLKENFINLNSFIHKKSLYEKYGGFDENLENFADWDLIIRYTRDNSPSYINLYLVNYKINDSQRKLFFDKSLKDDCDIIHERYWLELYKDDYECIKDYFDENYYIKEYGDQLSKNLTPIHHFLSIGHKEDKNPNVEFVTAFYRNQHENLRKNKNLNPFVYYIKNGLNKHKINYFDEKEEIINHNSQYLSNYKFDNEPLVSIIILNRNGLNHLKRLFKDFSKKTNYSNFEIIVVDNASTDNSVEYLKNLNLDIKIIENTENTSFAIGNNEAVKIAKGDYILLLNNDIEPTYGWLNEMMGTIIYNENVAAVGAKLIYPYIDDYRKEKYSFTVQHTGDILRESKDSVCIYKGHNQNKFSKEIFAEDISVNRKRLLVTGAVLLIKKSVYLELNGLDENYSYGYEDIDFNLRVYEKGYDILFASAALLFHYESATRKRVNRNNHSVFCKKWSNFLFKQLLKDKIEKNYFFTDKKLEFLVVKDPNLNDRDNTIQELTKYCFDNQYIINIDQTNSLDINENVDVLISFNPIFDIEKIDARDNIITIFILFKNHEKDNLDLSGYDLVISDDFKLVNDDNVYFLENYNNLGENLISILYERYLN